MINKEKKIRILIKKEKLESIDFEELILFCKNQWKILIIKAVDEIENEIDSRKTRGGRFSDILVQVEKIKEDLIDVNDYELELFENTYLSDIKYLRQDAKERIDNEIFTNRQKRKNLILNVLIAFVFFVLGLYFKYA